MVFDGLGASGDPELQLAGVAAETGQQRIAGDVGGRVVPAPRNRQCVCSATRSHSAGEGCGSHRCTSRCSASATTTSSCAVVNRVGPNSDNRYGRSTRSGSARSRSQAAASRSARLGDAHPAAHPPPQLGLPAQVVGNVARRRRSPRSGASTGGARRMSRTGQRGGGRWPAAVRCGGQVLHHRCRGAGPASRTTPAGRIRRWSPAMATPTGRAPTGRCRARCSPPEPGRRRRVPSDGETGRWRRRRLVRPAIRRARATAAG